MDGVPGVSGVSVRDLDTQRVYRLYDATKALPIRPHVAYFVAGKVDNAGKLYLVIESVWPDTQTRLAFHCSCSR